MCDEALTVDPKFLTDSIAVAFRMVEACLPWVSPQTSLLRRWMGGERLNTWTDLIGDQISGQRTVGFRISIDKDFQLGASCAMTCVNGEWTAGTVEISNLGTTHKFACSMRSGENEIFVTRLN